MKKKKNKPQQIKHPNSLNLVHALAPATVLLAHRLTSQAWPALKESVKCFKTRLLQFNIDTTKI